MKKKYLIWIGSIIVGLFLFELLTRNHFVLSTKPPRGVTRSRQEAIEKGVHIRDYVISDIIVRDSSYTFPFKAVWLETPWHWELKYFFFKEPCIDSIEVPYLVFQVKENSELYERNFGIKWQMKKCEEERGYYVGLLKSQIFSHKIKLDRDTLCYAIYKDGGIDIEEENLIFQFSLIKKD